ncbi:MAG TPA: DUF6600 domain-containing protein [Burkholderiaceae bacterium]|nr:DUF6600 domain-containing protein [Burkholderiaceae bacterium]
MPNQTAYSATGLLWRRRLRLAATLLVALAIGTAVNAQTDPATTTPAADPPARVGRISLISGPVTLTDYRANEESDATLNWPLTSQQRLSTGRLGRAEVRIGSTSVRIDGDSVLDFNRIDDEMVQLTLQRGSASMRVRNREHLREIDFLTPRERVVFEDVGRYRIDVDRSEGISAITVHVGSARVVGARTNFVVQSGQRGETSADPVPNFQLVTPASDVFDDWVAARDHRDDSLQSTRYVSAETTGVESLDDHGEWRSDESYGAVWFPTGVVAGWAPYRYGRWAHVAPWGWTWIDDASWGFTPFHYGRWVFVHNTWGWVPGAYIARPCYAPALVAWYGTPGVSVSVSFGGPVGWFPLGPGEVFIPGYYYSRRYVNSVNYGHVTNINYITVINPPPNYRYRQPSYSTWVPGEALVRRTPINRVVQPAPSEWAKLPTMQHPPVKVTEDLRRSKQSMVNAIAPVDAPRPGVPSRDVGHRPNDPSRIEAPVRMPPTRVNPGERDAKSDPPGRPPLTKVTPNDERVPTPVQRVPRLEAPRAETPRQAQPRGETPPAPRPPKAQPIERAPAAPPRQVAAPAQQIAPRPAPRQEAPVQPAVPRAAPPVHQEAPVHRVAPPQREQNAENAQRPKTQRQVESQRN